MIRLANVDDYNSLIDIFDLAKQYMRENGNPNQWLASYPGPNFIQEILDNKIYILEEDKVYATFYLHIGEDPTYHQIDGGWIRDKRPYTSLHRVASDGSRAGILNEIVLFAKKFGHDIRIDTHRDNKLMQENILRNGFKYCGIIYLENGDERLAYQYINN